MSRGRLNYRQDLPEGQLCQYCFTHLPIFGFFAPQGGHVAPLKVKFSSSLPNFTLIGLGLWVYGPKTLKISNFTNIIAPKGRVPCTILTKFTGFMRVLSLHKSVKFGCFSSMTKL